MAGYFWMFVVAMVAGVLMIASGGKHKAPGEKEWPASVQWGYILLLAGFFGVLSNWMSFSAVMLVIVRLSTGWGGWLWPAGLAAIVLPELVTPLLQQQGWGLLIDSRWLNWLGFVTGKPPTEDYVPLLPWLGVVWWGLAAGQWLLARHPGVVQAPVGAPGRALARLGRWSLTYYLAHQPVMIGLLSAWLALRR